MTSNVSGGGNGGNIMLTNIDLEETVVDEANDVDEMTTTAMADQAVYPTSSSSSNFSINDNGTSPPCFVAVHIGAGFHSQNRTGTYRLLCEQICSSVIALLRQGCKARLAAATACALLENSPMTNAGLGSNLTLNDKIECDASIMDRDGFGSVGAVSNVKNPIMVALSLLEAQSKGTLSMGRIVPCMLVGHGATQWAHENGIEQVDDEFLKTDPMRKSFYYYKKKLDELNNGQTDHYPTTEPLQASGSTASLFDKNDLKSTDSTRSLDTVGAIVLDKSGHLASAISSGGILLKLPGRVGHASFFGCGCWVQEDEDSEKSSESNSVAICTTGCGEYIIKTLFAKQCVDHILAHKNETDYNLNQFFTQKFFNAPLLKNSPDKLIGAMICKLQTIPTSEMGNEKKLLELLVTHTTPSMCFGFMSSNMRKAKSVMSRKDENETKSPTDTVLISSFPIDLSSPANHYPNHQQSTMATSASFSSSSSRLDTPQQDESGDSNSSVKKRCLDHHNLS